MDINRVQSLTDVIHDSIDYSGIEREILGTPIFNRLHRIMQSSLVFLTYPSDKVKRFEHSIGVMHLAGELFFSSVCNSSDEVLSELLGEIKISIKTWRSNCKVEHLSQIVPRNTISKFDETRILSLPFPRNLLYTKRLPANVSNLSSEDKLAYIIAFQAIRIAGLLHDVGHMPYSHVLEHAINNLYAKVNAIPEETRNVNQKVFLQELFNYCDPSCDEKDELHEEIGKMCSTKIYECIANITEPHDNNLFFVSAYDFACAILRSIPSDNNIYSDLHRIIAGVVDVDRLDYCNRDACCTGINRDRINYRRFFSTFTVCRQETNPPLEGEEVGKDVNLRKSFYFCPDVKNIALIDDLLQRRWNIFSLVNLHHRVHKHETLMEEVIAEIGLRELEDIKPIEDIREGVLPLKIFSIVQIIKLLKGNNPPEYLLMQFDDSWMDTLLKRKFRYIYPENYMWSKDVANNAFWNRYDELISVQKHYHSGFKRTEDFKSVDTMLFSKFKKIKDNGFGQLNLPEEIKDRLNAEFAQISDYNSFRNKYRSLFFNWLLSNTALKIAVLPQQKNEFFKEVQDAVNENLKPLNKIEDVIIRDCSFKLGCTSGKTILMVSDNGTAKPFKNYSIIEHVLLAKRNDSLPLHLFYLPRLADNATTPYDFRIDKSIDIYQPLANTIWDCVIKLLSERKTVDEKGGN